MLLPTFITTSVLALTANAFLVPLEVADDAKAAKALTNSIIPSSQTINLDCSACPFAQQSNPGHHIWVENGPKTNLEMAFAISEDKQSLTLNGVSFYPPNVDNLAQVLKTKQVIQPGEAVVQGIKAFDGDLGLSYSLEVQPQKVEDGVTLTPLSLQVLGLDGQMVNVDSIILPIISTSNGGLSLAETKTAPPPFIDSCTTIMCRVRSIIISKIMAARVAALRAMAKMAAAKNGCMRKLGFKPAEPPKTEEHKQPSHPKVHGGPDKFRNGKSHPKNGSGPHGHHGKHGLRKVFCSVKRIFKHIVVPVMIGIAAGMAASAVGMLIGQVVVLLWVKYRSRARGNYVVVEQVEEGRVSGEEGLPMYEDVVNGEVDEDEKELLS